MEITEETYTVYKSTEEKYTIKEFENFEDAYEYYKKDKDEYLSGSIVHTYKVTEEYFEFDKRRYDSND